MCGDGLNPVSPDAIGEDKAAELPPRGDTESEEEEEQRAREDPQSEEAVKETEEARGVK